MKWHDVIEMFHLSQDNDRNVVMCLRLSFHVIVLYWKSEGGTIAMNTEHSHSKMIHDSIYEDVNHPWKVKLFFSFLMTRKIHLPLNIAILQPPKSTIKKGGKRWK